MEAELGEDMADLDGDVSADVEEDEDPRLWRCSSTSVRDRVDWVAELDHVRT